MIVIVANDLCAFGYPNRAFDQAQPSLTALPTLSNYATYVYAHPKAPTDVSLPAIAEVTKSKQMPEVSHRSIANTYKSKAKTETSQSSIAETRKSKTTADAPLSIIAEAPKITNSTDASQPPVSEDSKN